MATLVFATMILARPCAPPYYGKLQANSRFTAWTTGCTQTPKSRLNDGPKPNKRSYFGGPGRLEGLGFGIQGLMRMQGSELWLLLGFKSEGSEIMVPEFKSFGLRGFGFRGGLRVSCSRYSVMDLL